MKLRFLIACLVVGVLGIAACFLVSHSIPRDSEVPITADVAERGGEGSPLLLSSWGDFNIYWEPCSQDESVYVELRGDGSSTFYRLKDCFKSGSGLEGSSMLDGASYANENDDFDCWTVDVSTGALSRWALSPAKKASAEAFVPKLSTYKNKWVLYLNIPNEVEDGDTTYISIVSQAKEYESCYRGLEELVQRGKLDSEDKESVESYLESPQKEYDSLKTLIVRKASDEVRSWLIKKYGEAKISEWGRGGFKDIGSGFRDYMNAYFDYADAGWDSTSASRCVDRVISEKGW